VTKKGKFNLVEWRMTTNFFDAVGIKFSNGEKFKYFGDKEHRK
jgi:hypothetical protein